MDAPGQAACGAEVGLRFRGTVCTRLEKYCDPNVFSAVPAKAGTQRHGLRSSGLKLLMVWTAPDGIDVPE